MLQVAYCVLRLGPSKDRGNGKRQEDFPWEPVNGVASEPSALEENTGLASVSPTHYVSPGEIIFFFRLLFKMQDRP